MGLDIFVSVTPTEVREALRSNSLHAELKLFDDAVRRLDLKNDTDIHVRPGSYAGLHRVRCLYAELKGIFTGDTLTDWQDGTKLMDSHLVWHSDSSGCYVPYDTEGPHLEVGSSDELLKELLEIPTDSISENDRRAYDAMLVVALASTATGEMIVFS